MRRQTKKSNLQLKSPLRLAFTSILFIALLSIFWFTRSISEAHSPEPDQPPTLYANQINDDLREVMLTGINEAKESILLIIYTLKDEKIIKSLNQKSKDGVHVSIICDAVQCALIERKFGKKVHIIKRFASGLMHQKILVVDEAKVWIGSANMTSSSLKLHANLITGMHSPLLAKTIKEKSEKMHSGKTLFALHHKEFTIGGQKVELWFFPDDPKGVEKLTNLIRAAKKSIRVAMFTWTRLDLANEIIEAHKRGIKTEIVIDHNASLSTGAKVVKLLKEGGIPVRLSQGTDLLHHKFLYIDNKILVNGSANWTEAAFTKNDDCFIILHDLTTLQKKSLNKLWDVMLTESKCP